VKACRFSALVQARTLRYFTTARTPLIATVLTASVAPPSTANVPASAPMPLKSAMPWCCPWGTPGYHSGSS